MSNARELIAMNRKTGHLLIVELQLDRNAFIDVMREDGALDARELFRIEQSDGDQTRQCGIELRRAADQFADQFQLIRRQIFGHHDAVAIEDQPPAGRYRVGADAITL